MASLFEGLKPSHLWKHFEQILKTPHCSGNEKALGDYIISVAEANNLKWKRDETGNVVVRKEATSGYENATGVILQGHLDMVCEKNSDVVFDFSHDPIQASVKGDWIRAIGTTLGADNGIGLSAALAIMEEKTLKHPPMEFLFTVDEETGLTGATRIQPGFLEGKSLLNLDSEEEGEFTIGCAGGADTVISLPLQRESNQDVDHYQLKLYGFRGGHSGIDINQGRGNAIKLLARILWQGRQEIPFGLTSIEGGNLRNAIPREAWANLTVKTDHAETLRGLFKASFDKIACEFKAVESEACFTFEKTAESPLGPLQDTSQQKLVNMLVTLPHGVISMHPEMEGLVETSSNLAVVRTHEGHAEVICSTRSSVASALQAARNMISAVCNMVEAKVDLQEGYPGWTPNLQSPLLKALKDVYSKTYGKEPKVGAIHAGLECGIIGEKFPGMDMISFGPTIEHPHSPEERVHIGSVEIFWEFLTTVLAELN
jgi:dipeptidase D